MVERIEWDDFNRKDVAPWDLSGLWKFDNLPVSVKEGELSYRDTPETQTDYSLNYNGFDFSTNGYDYSTGAANSGSATLEGIDLEGYREGELTFWCNYDIDDKDYKEAAFDQRSVEVRWLGMSYKLLLRPMGTEDVTVNDFQVIDVCSEAEGKWHKHTVNLESIRESFQRLNWDDMAIAVTFRFDSKDHINNRGAGWFIDDFEITGRFIDE